ncbi:MAG: hypothetical protein KGL31_13750 [candidate division NC10 bacterium]|nr:hypothetical protein [candidate division NC10 bacterium]
MSVLDEMIRQKVVQWLAYGGGGKIGTGTIIVTIRGVYGHDRACYGLAEPLHPATRIM